jgi:hypothetical protein
MVTMDFQWLPFFANLFTFRCNNSALRRSFHLSTFILLCPCLFAQNASLSGRVTDESGAIVQGATVTLSDAKGAQAAITHADGGYFLRLTSGDYMIAASAPQLALPKPVKITIHAGANTFDLQLKVISATQQLTVEENAGPALSTDAANNASATVIRGEDLDALSDDPEDLAADLQALAGPAAGPSGGAIFVDGFSGGQLPPKESIREIRINQNPFSPEYDKLGYGRIEIFTKPGSDHFHGIVGYNLGTSVWDGRNPYASQKAPFLLQEFEDSFSGPLGKRTSFTLEVGRHMVDNGSVTNGVVLNPQSLIASPFTSVVTTPQRRWLVNPHIDYRLNDNNTLTLRYLFTHGDIRDSGIGGFDLIPRGFHLQFQYNTVQIAETSVHGTSVNETRFQYYRTTNQTNPNTIAPEIQVSGSFNDGGATIGNGHDAQNSFELQNYTSILHGNHAWRFGVRLRGQTDDSYAPVNYNGAFTFSGGLGPELTANNQPVLDASGQPVISQISSIEQYRRTLIGAPGGGPSLFTINGGNPETSVHQMDGSAFVGDDWRLRPNFTLNLGLRYEIQTNIHDHADVAPRVAFAWAPGGGNRTGSRPAKTVIRGGFGVFYDRFALANTLAADRYNGVVQQQYVVTNPGFYPSIPSLASLSANRSAQAIQEIDAHLRAPYIMQSAATLERQLPRSTTLAITYTNSHGVHVLRSEDINAPLPGTFVASKPVSGVFPYALAGPIFLMTSSGLYNQNQLIFNVNSKISPAVSLFGYYVFNRANSNSDGLNTYPANPYNFSGEYGRAATDIHNRFIFAGTIATRWLIRLNPFITAQSGTPFNITTGEDLFGTTLYNSRPGIAADPSRPGVIATPYGLLDPNPIAGEQILRRNAGRGPWMVSLNLRVNKTWGFGPEKTSGEVVSSRSGSGQTGSVLTQPPRGLFAPSTNNHRYSVVAGMSVRNLLNHTNPGPTIGNIASPLFGRANQMFGQVNGEGFSENAVNRKLELQLRFVF